MAQQEFPALNDIAPSWADIVTSFTVLGGGSILETIDYSAINWSSSAELGEQRGASGGRVMKRTTGSVSHEASATFYRSGLRKLYRALVDKAPSRGNQKLVGLVAFNVQVQHTPPGETDIYDVRIRGCRLTGLSASMTEGVDADQVELALNPIEIVEIIDGVEVALL